MPNITRGSDLAGVMRYLVGPGRHNEHTEPHLVAGDPAILAWHDDAELSRADAVAIAEALDRPRELYDVTVPDGHVWHCSLSLKAEEGRLTDQRWAAIATDFVTGMGFTGEEPGGIGRADCRWVAVHHGTSTAGNDHIHLVVALVREDGTKASVWRDRPRAQALAGELERRHGLQVLESREHARGDRGVKPAELAKAERTGAAEPARVTLSRTVRGCAAAAGDEAEFVRRMRTGGLIVRSRLAAGDASVVVGYSVAARPGAGETPVWFGGGTLARDLTLPRLRAAWPDSPQHADAAAVEWSAARRNRRPVAPGRELAAVSPEQWGKAAGELRALRDFLGGVPAADRATWAWVAQETSGAFAAWSRQVEATPGPLAAAADALASAGQMRASEVKPRPVQAPSPRNAALLLASVASGGKGTVAQTVMLRQLTLTVKALTDARTAAGEAGRAQQITQVMETRLAEVRDQLPALPTKAQLAGQVKARQGSQPVTPERPVLDAEAAEALRLSRVGQVPAVAARAGSVLPADLVPGRRRQVDSGRDDGRAGR